CQQYSSDPLTF
nr:immunoglobulin light chain junction region [Macaca mulatta]MOV77239.1 immunoglobulin light chain junction region [Macaca mulatta]